MELAIELDADIPAGWVAVFLGSCGSGAMIEKNGISARGTSKSWEKGFIDAFAALHPETENKDENPAPRYNELTVIDEASSTKSYYVMAAAERLTSSSGSEGGSSRSYNYFATWVGESAGYRRNGIWEEYTDKNGQTGVRYRSGKASSGMWSSSIPGDTNKNKEVSFLECYNYVYNQKYNIVIGKLVSNDTPLKYSSGSDFPLFRR